MNLSWCLYLVMTLISSPHSHSAVAPENEVPLRPTTWMVEGKITPVHLTKGRTRRLYFTLQTKTLTVTVSPCSATVHWSLSVHVLKDKPSQSLHWSSRKSMPEVWWKRPGKEAVIHTYTGNTVDVYTGPAREPDSVYTVRLSSTEQDTQVTVHLHEGPGPSGAFPELPPDPRVHVLGLGMTSVTLSWAPSPSISRTSPHSKKVPYEYCVLVNHNHQYKSLCAAREQIRKEIESEGKEAQKDEQRAGVVVPALKARLQQHWDGFKHTGCVCREAESVCTVSDLLPDTRYYFDVFLIDSVNGTSAAYTGALAHTHEEARRTVTPLREGQVQWVTVRTGSADTQRFRFRPRGWRQNGLLTLQCCGSRAKVSVFSRGKLLFSQDVGDQLAQIWLEGAPSYLIRLQVLEGSTTPRLDRDTPRPMFKLQASSAYHRRAPPVLPPTLQLRSFKRLRGCSSVTLAWMGTEERSLYCLYQRRIADRHTDSSTDPCLGPESRPATEQVFCKYFQELDPRRAITTAVIRGLDPDALYVFDVYLMRRWGLPVKYHSKTVKTKKEC